MKISERTHPVIRMLKTKELGVFNVFECDKELLNIDKESLNNEFKRVTVGVNNQIYYVTQPFIDAYEKAGDKLFYSNLWDKIEDDNICLITPWGECSILKIRNDIKNKIITTSCFNFMQKNVLTFFGEFFLNYSDGLIISTKAWQSKAIAPLGFGNDTSKHLQNCLLITLFIKYAEVETVALKPKESKRSIDCKYVNDTRMPIVYLDSKWFTTLVKSDAFKVRGHFRLQAHGEGLKERKLIWINDFEKKGYTAPARKIC